MNALPVGGATVSTFNLEGTWAVGTPRVLQEHQGLKEAEGE